jgi:hypothetical protein
MWDWTDVSISISIRVRTRVENRSSVIKGMDTESQVQVRWVYRLRGRVAVVGVASMGGVDRPGWSNEKTAVLFSFNNNSSNIINNSNTRTDCLLLTRSPTQVHNRPDPRLILRISLT